MIECPFCCGEGYDFELTIFSDYPALMICEFCDGHGTVKPTIICRYCGYHISGPWINLELDIDDLIDYGICNRCPEQELRFDSNATNSNNTISFI